MVIVPVWPLRDAEAGREQKQKGCILTVWYGKQGSRITNEYLQPLPILQQGSPISPFMGGGGSGAGCMSTFQASAGKTQKRTTRKAVFKNDGSGGVWGFHGRKPCGQVSRKEPRHCQQDQVPWAQHKTKGASPTPACPGLVWPPSNKGRTFLQERVKT